MEFQFTNESKGEESTNETTNTSGVTSCNDLLNSNNDQPLFCMKIIVIFSQLTQFKPDYWSLVNGDNQTLIKKIYAKIKKSFKMVKDSINCLFQVYIKQYLTSRNRMNNFKVFLYFFIKRALKTT